MRSHTEASRHRISLQGTTLALILAVLGLVLFDVANAAAAKQLVNYFGTSPGKNDFGVGSLGGEFRASAGIAVNNSGAGPGDQGDIYVADELNNRIQRFVHDDNGTPANPYDDTYPFIAAWGAGVESSGSDYEICTVATSCKAGTASGANGGLDRPAGVAIDQDSGDLYVADHLNYRVSVYDGAGTFLRAFGWDVVASGPGDSGTGYEVCVAVDGDVCKAGLPGAGVGQIGEAEVGATIAVSPPDGDPATGTVFLADLGSAATMGANQRINTYDLDGGSPSSLGSPAVFGQNVAPNAIAIDSRGIVYAYNRQRGEILRYDSQNANGGGIGFLDPIFGPTNELQNLALRATAGQYKLSFDPDGAGPLPSETTVDLPFDATSSAVREALEDLPSIGAGNVFTNSFLSNDGVLTNTVEFRGALASSDVAQLVVSNGFIPLTGSIDVSTAHDGHDGPLSGPQFSGITTLLGLAVDLDSDGPGPDSDVLYVQNAGGEIQQFGPVNAPGLSTPPSAADEVHGDNPNVTGEGEPKALALDEADGSIYVTAGAGAAQRRAQGVYVLNTAPPAGPPAASFDSISDITSNSATVHATVNPNGPPNVGYRIEYSTDGSTWSSTPEVTIGSQETPQAIEAVLDPPPGLEPNTLYHVRLVVQKRFFAPLVTAEKTFTTLATQPLVETTGSPVRSVTTARLDGRVSPNNSPTTYYFEYGTQGPCETNPCSATEAREVGSGSAFSLVSEQLNGLEANTTYHYRVVAENGASEDPVVGEDMTLTTLLSDAPLSHGPLPGPPGSDRAWEHVSAPDTGGNPINAAQAISDDGNRAIYQVSGGTPLSETGTLATRLFAERTASGWQTRKILPNREQATENFWFHAGGPGDLSKFVAANYPTTSAGEFSVWRMEASGAPTKLLGADAPSWDGFLVASDDASKVVVTLEGSPDPEHPASPGTKNLYDIGSGEAHMVGLLPDGSVPACGVAGFPIASETTLAMRWLSSDGSRAFFSTNCGGSLQLYTRDLRDAQTKLIGSGSFLKSTPGAVFFRTTANLDPQDTSGNDVYRYALDDDALKCVTCVVPGLAAAVSAGSTIGVAANGSRVYFQSDSRLLAGAAPTNGTYRVEVASGDLAYVGSGIEIGDAVGGSNRAMTGDGSVAVFTSTSSSLNAIGGQQNAGTRQYYRYDDRDRSLVCISCPGDGSAPRGEVSGALGSSGLAPNTRPLDQDGGTVVFDTPTPLAFADQNTAGPGQDSQAGTDIYEWRDGKLLLISDGLTDWPVGGAAQAPMVGGITPSGRDIFFTEAAQLTADALDGYRRLYDARVGGGFEFPPPPKPCPLEVCQGIPKGAPEEAAAGTTSFAGFGAAKSAPKGPARCAKGKRKVRKGGKARCVARKSKKRQHKTSNDRRATR